MSINMLCRFMALKQTILQIMETLEFLFQGSGCELLIIVMALLL